MEQYFIACVACGVIYTKLILISTHFAMHFLKQKMFYKNLRIKLSI